MWYKSFEPPIILPPKHAALFRTAAAWLSDLVGTESLQEDWMGMGIDVFDNLSQGQKQAVILVVAKALLDPNTAPPKVTAVTAGTVAAIYELLRDISGDEIGPATSIRQMILEAMDEKNYWNEINDGREPSQERVERLSVDCADINEWSLLIDNLESDILEDYDFGLEGSFLDMAPEQSHALKEVMSISRDYFVAVVEDPTPERLAVIRSELAQLLNSL